MLTTFDWGSMATFEVIPRGYSFFIFSWIRFSFLWVLNFRWLSFVLFWKHKFQVCEEKKNAHNSVIKSRGEVLLLFWTFNIFYSEIAFSAAFLYTLYPFRGLRRQLLWQSLFSTGFFLGNWPRNYDVLKHRVPITII